MRGTFRVRYEGKATISYMRLSYRNQWMQLLLKTMITTTT